MSDIDCTFDDDILIQTFGDLIVSKMQLIGIAGKARSGKGTTANYLLNKLGGEWSAASFADPIKAMLETIGLSCNDETKHMIDVDYNVTPRLAMQTLGTEWGRNLIDGDIWVKAFTRLNQGQRVIVPDVRFENEADLIRQHGILIHVTGRGGIDGSHISEQSITVKEGDIVISNDRCLPYLYASIDSLVNLESMEGRE